MKVTRFETTIYPNTEQGEKLAGEYQKEWEEQDILVRRTEDTQTIVLTLGYQFEIADEEVENDNKN